MSAWAWLPGLIAWARGGHAAAAACAWALHVMTFSPTDPHGAQGPSLSATRTYATARQCQRKAAAFYRVDFAPGVIPLAFCVQEREACHHDEPGR